MAERGDHRIRNIGVDAAHDVVDVIADVGDRQADVEVVTIPHQPLDLAAYRPDFVALARRLGDDPVEDHVALDHLPEYRFEVFVVLARSRAH